MIRAAVVLCLIAVSLQACPAGYYTNAFSPLIGNCIQCPFPCIECGNSSLSSCTKYADGYTVNGISYCALGGGTTTYLNPQKNVCESTCLTGCSACSEGDNSYCFSCQVGYVLEGNTCKSSILYNAVLIGLLTFLAVIKVGELLYQFYKYRQAREKKAEAENHPPNRVVSQSREERLAEPLIEPARERRE